MAQRNASEDRKHFNRDWYQASGDQAEGLVDCGVHEFGMVAVGHINILF